MALKIMHLTIRCNTEMHYVAYGNFEEVYAKKVSKKWSLFRCLYGPFSSASHQSSQFLPKTEYFPNVYTSLVYLTTCQLFVGHLIPKRGEEGNGSGEERKKENNSSEKKKLV